MACAEQGSAQIVKSLNLKAIVTQIVNAGELLLLTSKSRLEWRRSHRSFSALRRLLTKTPIARQTWQLNLERGLGFSEGFEEGVEEEMLWTFILLRLLQDADDAGHVAKAMADLKQSYPRLHHYLTQHTSHVELSRRIDGEARVDKIYFPVDRSVVLLSKSADFKEEVDAMIRSVPRANSIEKFRELLRRLKATVSLLKWLHFLTRSGTMRWFIRHRRQVNHAPIRMAALITVLLLLFYGLPMDPNSGELLADGRFFAKGAPPAGYSELDYPFANRTSDPLGQGATYGKVVQAADLSLKYRVSLKTRWESEAEWEYMPEMKTVILVLGIAHAILTLVGGLTHLVLDFPLSWVRSLQEVSEEARKQVREPQLGSAPPEGFDTQSSASITTGTSEDPPPPVDIRVHVSTAVVMWRALRRVPEVGMHAALLTLSVIGVAKSPILFVFCLADYFRLPGGQMVVRALREGAPALFRSLLVGVIVISLFAFLSYSYFSQSAIISDDTCHSPFQCVSKHILDAFRGDITTVLGNFASWAFPPMVIWADSWYALRTLMILAFLLWWAFLLQPVIQGQIIDAFIKLRKAQDDANTEMENKCFISGIDRFKFDALQDEWEARRGGKYAWNYLFFLFWLSVQEPEDLTCIQLQVWDKVAKDKADFFPAGVSAAIQKDDGNDSAQEVLHDWIVTYVHDRLERQQLKIDEILALVRAQETKKTQGLKEELPDLPIEGAS